MRKTNLSQVLADYKEKHNLTNNALSQKVGITPAQVGRLLKGQNPHPHTIYVISKNLDIPIEEILKEKTHD